eukprot:Skav224871  [mRNA]  locus=scaffold1112:79999:102419:+ [translate_table: standard]
MLVYLLTLWAIAGAVEIGSTHETQSGAEDPDESDEASDENDPSGSESSDDSPSSLSSSNTSATANASATANTSATANSTAAINSTADANSTALANATKHSVSDSQEKSDADMDASDEETSGTESSEKAESESSESTEAADKESTDNKEDSSESAESSTDNPSDTADSTDSKTQSTDGSTEADGKTESADSQADSADSQADTETSETESEGSEDTQEGAQRAKAGAVLQTAEALWPEMKGRCESAWDAFNRYISEVVGKKQTLNISSKCALRFSEGLTKDRLFICWSHLVFFSTRSGFDLACLFHAKEHPEEFTNRMGPVLPVCSSETGGQSDPRRGTRLSIKDENFKDRNFLWLQSLNTTFRFDLAETDSKIFVKSERCAALLLAPGASGSRFFTIDESNFGTQLGTICYLPKAQDPAVPYQPCAASAADLLCTPCHGFTPDWHLARVLAHAKTETDEEAAIRNMPIINAELLALLDASDPDRKRVQRLGTPDRRARLLTLARQELRRREALLAEKRQRHHDEAIAKLISRGFARSDVQANKT